MTFRRKYFIHELVVFSGLLMLIISIGCSSNDIDGGADSKFDIDLVFTDKMNQEFSTSNWCTVYDSPDFAGQIIAIVKPGHSGELNFTEYEFKNKSVGHELDHMKYTYTITDNTLSIYKQGQSTTEFVFIIEKIKNFNGHKSIFLKDKDGTSTESYACDINGQATKTEPTKNFLDDLDDESIFPDEGPFDGDWYTECFATNGRSSYTHVSIGWGEKIMEYSHANPICLGLGQINSPQEIIGGPFVETKILDISEESSSATIEFVKTKNVNNPQKYSGDKVNFDEPIFLKQENGFRYSAKLSGATLILTPISIFERLEGETIFDRPANNLKTLSMTKLSPIPPVRNKSDIPSSSKIQTIFSSSTCGSGFANVLIAKFSNPNVDDLHCSFCLYSEKVALISSKNSSVISIIRFERRIKPQRIGINGEWRYVDELGEEYSTNTDWSYLNNTLFFDHYGKATVSASGSIKLKINSWPDAVKIKMGKTANENVMSLVGCPQ